MSTLFDLLTLARQLAGYFSVDALLLAPVAIVGLAVKAHGDRARRRAARLRHPASGRARHARGGESW